MLPLKADKLEPSVSPKKKKKDRQQPLENICFETVDTGVRNKYEAKAKMYQVLFLSINSTVSYDNKYNSIKTQVKHFYLKMNNCVILMESKK